MFLNYFRMILGKFRKLILLVSLILPLMASCSKPEGYQRVEGMIWNTSYHITYKGPVTLKDSILPALNDVGHSLSVFEKNSLVSELNRNDSVEYDSHMLKVYEASKKINSISRGTFDPTVSPLIEAWGFGRSHTPTRDTLAIDSVLE